MFYFIVSACWMLSTGLMFLSIALMYLTFGLLDL